MTAPSEASEEARASFPRDAVARAADLMIDLYGMEAIRRAERICPPSRQGFAEAVLQEVKARLAQ